MLKNKLKLKQVATKNKEDKNINRSSSQRISLFKYPNVEVETSSDDYKIKSNGNGKLLARGPIEIYEMRTVSSQSFFLSVGRRGEWIHPMLPKLKIRRMMNTHELNLFVSFSNPDRIWKIKFIECDELNVDDEMVRNLEDVITSICQYSCVKSLKSPYDSIVQESDDELNYLLESSENDEDEDSELTDVEDSINDAFKRAMNNVIPPWRSIQTNNEVSLLSVPKIRQDKPLSKRNSLYIPSTTTTTSITTNNKMLNRRSIFVFSDYETLISLQNLKL